MLSIDWLSFSVVAVSSAPEREAGELSFSCPDGFLLQYLGGTNIFKYRAYLLDDGGDKVLTLLWHPFSRIINPDTIFVEVANKCLYARLDWVLDLLWKIHPFAFGGLSRYDLAYDFNPSSDQYDTILQLALNQYYVQGKKEGSFFYEFEHSGQKVLRLPKQLSWGSKASNIKWKLYNKSLEVFEPNAKGELVPNKPYIVDRWREEGLEVDKVWRLECSITSANKFKFEDSLLSYECVTNPSFFERLFKSLYQFRFVIRKNEGHTDKSNDKIVPFLRLGRVLNRIELRDPRREQKFVELAAILRDSCDKLRNPSVYQREVLKGQYVEIIKGLLSYKWLESYFVNLHGMVFDKWLSQLDAELVQQYQGC